MGSGEPMWIEPWLSGRIWKILMVIPESLSNYRVVGSKLAGANKNCMSGVANSGLVLTKPCPTPAVKVNRPRRLKTHLRASPTNFKPLDCSLKVIFWDTCQQTRVVKWSR